MKTDMNTVVANPGEIADSAELAQDYIQECELAKERQAIRNFGTLGFNDYCDWILNNLLPLS